MVTTDVMKIEPSNGYNLFNEEQQALHDAYVKTGDDQFLWKLQDLVKNPSKEWAIRSAKNVIRHAGMSADDVAVEKKNKWAIQSANNVIRHAGMSADDVAMEKKIMPPGRRYIMTDTTKTRRNYCNKGIQLLSLDAKSTENYRDNVLKTGSVFE